ncbi:MAG: signal peptidase II [Oscillibacter sp.]|nr:signal peptidase II [Oscillibacter sp.]
MLLYLISFLVSAALFALDQWTKHWVSTNMTLGETAPLLGNLLELNCVHNYGVAWSLFSGMRWALIVVTGCIVVAVASALALRLIQHPVGVFAAFLILSGGMGNLVDRVFRGYVVDMIHLLFWPAYPTFNVADMCVVTGCVLWILYALFMQEPTEEQNARQRAKTREERKARKAALQRERHGASSVRTSAEYDASGSVRLEKDAAPAANPERNIPGDHENGANRLRNVRGTHDLGNTPGARNPSGANETRNGSESP